MIAPEDLYVMDLTALEEDLYRMGNATSPGFTEERAFKDVRVEERSGIKMVVADGNGYSAFSSVTVQMKAKGRNIWKIRKGSMLPEGLKIAQDLRKPTHYLLGPAKSMPLKKYLGILEELAADPLITVRMTPQEIKDAR